MIKKLLHLSLCMILGACVADFDPATLCLKVEIPRETAYLTQLVKYKDQFQIELTGYSGYCWFDARVKRNKATITPEFVVRRLQPSPDTVVDFSYYSKTLQGPPEYLGERTYFASTEIGATELEKKFSGRPIELKIPEIGKYDFIIRLGLVLSPEELKYNRRTFDVEYDYFEE